MPYPEPDHPHRDLIERRLPAWTRRALPEHWQSLRDSHAPAQGLPGAEADWFANAAPDLREAVLASQAALRRAQQDLARSLKGLQQITEFAEPLLKARLLAEHAFTAPLDDCELLRVQQTWHWQGARYLHSHQRQDLLQAALQNFAEDAVFDTQSAVALRDDIKVLPITVEGSVFISPDVPAAQIQLPSETYQVAPLPLSPAAFAATCRQLDLGQCYQAHLQHLFESPANQATVRGQAIAVHRQRLRVAADLGYLRHHLNGVAWDAVQALLDDQPQPCWQVSLFGIVLHEALIIDATAAGLLLYLPGNAAALRLFPSLAALHAALTNDLCDPAFRQDFMTYLPLDRLADFSQLLQQNLGDDLHLQRIPIGPGLFDFLQDDYLARLKAQARLLAVPTADADEQARQQRLAQWENVGMDLLTLAGFFIPAVGSLMLAVTAYQLLGEVYDGYAAWRIGDRYLALRHLEAIGLNLALLGGLHVAGKVVPRLFASPLLESLDEVPLDDGSHRLWQPALTPYRSEMQLPADLSANAKGQYLHEGRAFIRLDGELYEQRFDSHMGQWRVVHPQDSEAYAPPLEHNDEGAWRGEHEQPQAWTYPQMIRRLGGDWPTLGDDDLHLAGQISGVGKTRLQQIHLRNQPTPALLADTLARLAAEREVEARLAIAPQDDGAGMFTQAYEGRLLADDATRRLCQQYPRLSPPLADRLLCPLAGGQRQAWTSEGILPAFVGQDIAQVLDQLPLVRALEGLHLPRLAGEDSERLVLACLEQMPEWSNDLRLELREGSPQGPTVFSAGPTRATTLRIVIRSAEGYEADLGERPAPAPRHRDVCRAVLQALPPELRQAWALAVDDAAGLRRLVHARADQSRPALARQLARPAMRNVRSRGLLRGGAPTDYPPLSPQRASLSARYRRLYPAASDQQIEHDLAQWRRELRTPEVELRHREERLRQLRESLANWSGQTIRRQRAARAIINAWRQDDTLSLADGRQIQSLNLDGLELENHDLTSLTLPDDFAHVRILNLSRNRQLGLLPASFLQRFPELRQLYLNGCRLDHVPLVSNPSALEWIDLQENRITWDDQAQAALDSYPALRVLDLSDNPLLRAPNLSALPRLHSLHLSNCSLTQLPEGLQVMVEPSALDLSDNQFSALPQSLQLSNDAAQAMRLESPWLPANVHEQIEAYYAQHGVDLLVADSDYEELLEDTDMAQWQIWMHLPLQYRRNLRALLDTDVYLDHPDQAHAELWLRLQLMEANPAFRAYALANPAVELLQLRL